MMIIVLLRRIVLAMAKAYWKILRPVTFGVKGVVPNPKNAREILLVRHSYADRQRWNLPGGGYNPKRETASAAIAREIMEELSLAPSRVKRLGEYTTDAEGKRDTVTIFLCQTAGDIGTLNYEIAETAWVPIDTARELISLSIAALRGIELYSQDFKQTNGHIPVVKVE